MWKWYLVIAVAALIAYLPAVNNGFIADDYVILSRIEILKTNPSYLLNIVPENFRLSSYVVFGVLKAVFGYDYRAYYLFNILLHALNSLLLCLLVFKLTGEATLAPLAALLFAVFQAPQEAVMWLAAMNETLLGFFVFLTLLFWLQDRRALAGWMFLGALFSKESALIVLLILPIVDVLRNVKVTWSRYVALVPPFLVFAGIFLWTFSRNFQVGNGTYAVSPHAALVLVKSIHRLFWPWAYVVAVLLVVLKRTLPDRKTFRWALLIPITMFPYIFVTYTSNIPSRQVYLASAVFMPLLVAGMTRVNARVLVGVFLAFNIFYMWTTKDRQMMERAAPTTKLIRELRERKPGAVRVSGFAYPFGDVVKATAITVPGWSWDQVDLGDSCSDCLLLKWDTTARIYFVAN